MQDANCGASSADLNGESVGVGRAQRVGGVLSSGQDCLIHASQYCRSVNIAVHAVGSIMKASNGSRTLRATTESPRAQSISACKLLEIGLKSTGLQHHVSDVFQSTMCAHVYTHRIPYSGRM